MIKTMVARMAKRGTNDEVIEDDLNGDCVSEGEEVMEDDLNGDCVSEGAAVVVSITPLLTLDKPKYVKMIGIGIQDPRSRSMIQDPHQFLRRAVSLTHMVGWNCFITFFSNSSTVVAA